VIKNQYHVGNTGKNDSTEMWHTRFMVAPIEGCTDAVVGGPASQVPTICHYIGQPLCDTSHTCGKSKATEKIQHQRKK
jgi:hypothetical protein